MSTRINGINYYELHEVAEKAGLSRSTLLRWMKTGVIKEPIRDRRGWRIFSEKDLSKILEESSRTL